MTPSPPSQRDVARRAGVSQYTVSRALRGSPEISEPTRDRILHAAAALGYRPNPRLAQIMAAVRASTEPAARAILAVLLNASPADAAIPTYRLWMQGAKARADQLGYSLDPFHLHDAPILGSYLVSVLEHRGIQGVLLFDAFGIPLAPQLEPLLLRHPVAVLGHYGHGPRRFHHVANDFFETGALLVRRALKSGYRRPGATFLATGDTACDRLLASGIASVIGQLPPERQIPPLQLDLARPDRFHRWLKLWRPDCILSTSEHTLAWLGPKPRIGWATWSVATATLPNLPPLTGTDQNDHLLGAAAVDLLVAQILQRESGPPPSPKTILIQSSWRPGSTFQNRTAAEDPTWEARHTSLPRRGRWACLDLRPFFNQSLDRPNGWLGELPLLHLKPGQRQIHHIPFEILDGTATQGRNAIVLRSPRTPHFPSAVDIPLPPRATALAFLHGCGWADRHVTFARYEIHRPEAPPLRIPLTAFPMMREMPASPAQIERWKRSSNIQDSWPERGPFPFAHALPLLVTAEGDPTEYCRVLFTLIWRNPEPHRPLSHLTIRMLRTAGSTAFGCLAVSALNAVALPPSPRLSSSSSLAALNR